MTMICSQVFSVQRATWLSRWFVASVVAFGTFASVDAHEPEPTDPAAGGIGYAWSIAALTPGEHAQITGHVGAFSWKDGSLASQQMPGGQDVPAAQRGWTHTSNWVALNLPVAGWLEVSLASKAGIPFVNAQGQSVEAGDKLVPAFSLFKGWDNDASPVADPTNGNPIEDWHVYNNSGNVAWAEDLEFFANEPNSQGASTITRSFNVPAGLYTLVLGGNPGDSAIVRREGYSATFSMHSVPEPGLTGASALVLVLTGLRRRRRDV